MQSDVQQADIQPRHACSRTHTLLPMTCIRIVSIGAMVVLDNAPVHQQTGDQGKYSCRLRYELFQSMMHL